MGERTGATARRTRLASVLLATTLAIAAVALAAAGRPGVAGAAAKMPACPTWTPANLQCNQYPEPGPLGPISVFGDSVLLGSSDGLSSPGLPHQLADAGWGPVNFLAAMGYTTGRNLGAGRSNTAAYWINRWRAEGLDVPVVMINLGNNDMAYCPPDVGCMKQTIDFLLDVIGDQTEVWWPTLTSTDYHRADAWNTALYLAERERPNLHIWDWQGVFTAADPVPPRPVLHPPGRRRAVRPAQRTDGRRRHDRVRTVRHVGPERAGGHCGRRRLRLPPGGRRAHEHRPAHRPRLDHHRRLLGIGPTGHNGGGAHARSAQPEWAWLPHRVPLRR